MIWLILFCEDSRHEPSMTKPTKWHVHPARTQISLGIHPVWSESSLSAWRKLGSLATHWAHSEDSDPTGRMPRLIWDFAGCMCQFVGFVTKRLTRQKDLETDSRKKSQESRKKKVKKKYFHTRNLRFCQRCHEWAGYGASWIFPSDNHIVGHLHK